MCGIAGIMNLNADSNHSLALNKMMDLMYKRGPDSSGTFINRNIFLGMRRLSIMDEKEGDQPFSFQGGTVQLIFNGEIYNYHYLRKKLESHNYIFKTDCDTEIIGHAYNYFGEDFCKYLDGMFSIALWDDSKKTLFLVRDRIGIKPIYYFLNSSYFVFSSNIKSILACPFVLKEIDYNAMSQYLTKRFSNDNKTIYKNIFKVPPATLMKLDRKGKNLIKYWDLRRAMIDHSRDSIDKQEIINIYEKKFNNAVESHLMSDVPVGAFLSGGVDSTSIVALMSKYTDNQINTYSVGFSENSEIENARVVSKYFNTNHTELQCDAPSYDQLVSIFFELEEPIIDPAVIPTYFLSELASKDVKVVLTGEGSDEINGGYKKYFSSYYYNSFPYSVLKIFTAERKKKFLELLGKSGSRISQYLQYHISKSFINNQLYDYVDSDLKWKGVSNNIFSSKLKKDIISSQNISHLKSNLDMSFEDLLENHLLNDFLNGWLTNQLLLKVDKMSMASSLEARVPFLDHHLVEYAFSIPNKLKIENNVTKSIFRNTIKNIIPDKILDRKQHGFIVPISAWFNNEWSELLNSYLISGNLMNSENFNIYEIKKLVNRSKNGDNSVDSLLWSLLSMEIWYDANFQ